MNCCQTVQLSQNEELNVFEFICKAYVLGCMTVGEYTDFTPLTLGKDPVADVILGYH